VTRAPLARLLQLASPTLPVGAYSYSQGLEWAVTTRAVRDEAGVRDWIGTVLEHGVAAWDAPWVAALMRALACGADAEVAELNERFLASRETRELRAETLQTGRSLYELLRDNSGLPAGTLAALAALDAAEVLAYPTAWSAAAVAGGLAVEDALVAYLWSWLENAVLAALKTVPLGQRAGQRLLTELGGRLEALVALASACPPERCRNLLPGYALASMHHETQYTRLFRS
jgi:urease accessory protein